MKRGSNPHIGEMIHFRVDQTCFQALCDVKEASGRCGIDVVRLAIQHSLYLPELYEGLIEPEEATKRVDIRVSLPMRAELSDMAWRAGMQRNFWLAAILTRFFEQTDQDQVVSVLHDGEDLVHQLEQCDAQARPHIPQYSSLCRAYEGAHRRAQHGRGSPGHGVDVGLPGRVHRARL